MVTGASEEKWIALIQWARARAHELLPVELMSVDPDDVLSRLCESTDVNGSTTVAANQLVFDFANADGKPAELSEAMPSAVTLPQRKPSQPAA